MKRAALFALFLMGFASSSANAQQLFPDSAYVQMLYCEYGSVGPRPAVLPPDFESEFAVAVIEVNSSETFKHVPLPTVTLFDSAGTAIRTKRIISVEDFNEVYVRGDGNATFYAQTNPQGYSRPWDRNLPAGMVRLRVRVALATQSAINAFHGHCRVDLGPLRVEGPVDAEWPT